MGTKFFWGGAVDKYFNPYGPPYGAFINYMNVLSDFIVRVNDAAARAENDAAPTKTRRHGRR